MRTFKVLLFVALCWIVSVPATAASESTDLREHSASPAITPAAFSQEMRRLWVEHIIWTREYVVAALSEHPSASTAAMRLLRNQEHIGAAVATFYGEAAGRELTRLLKEHITIAVDVVKAAKSGDKLAFQHADAAWSRNGTDIADFLSKANPNWPRATLVEMMNSHLSTTTQAVVARLNNKWEDDVRAYDAVLAHILHMSDALAAGIVKQFPTRFSRSK